MNDDLTAVLDEGLVAMRAVGMRYAARAGRAASPEGFIPLSALVDEPGVLEELLERAGERWGTQEHRVRVALVLPPLIARLTRVACGCLLMGLPMPRMRGQDVLVRFGEASLLREMRLVGPVVSGDRVAAIRDELLGHHLAPLIERVRGMGGPTRPSLWGAVADGLAGACVEIGRELGDEDAGRRAGEDLVERCRPPLRRAVRWLTLECDGRRELTVDLQSCCLSHRLPSGVRCDSCPVRDPEERRTILSRRLAGPAREPVLAGRRAAWA